MWKFIDKVNNILQPEASEDTKKLNFEIICIENPATFTVFFKLYSKIVIAEVISEMDEGYEEKVSTRNASS